MAEQRANIDIEDVLSSIRRLVSEEPPRQRRPDVLVLTPALRVVEGSAPPKPSRSAPRPEPSSGWPAGLPFRETLQASPVRLTDFSLPEAEIAGLTRTGASQGSEAASRFTPAEAAPEIAPAPAEPPMPAEEEIAAFFSSRSRSEISLEERIADLQAAIAHSGAEFEPDGSELDESLTPQVVRRSDEDPRAARRVVTVDPVAPQARFVPPPRGGRIEDAVEVEAPRAAAYAAPEHRARPAQPAPQNDFEEALIDEDSLREIVGELVRQELRGELGERITRNVRSLIRRELNRALALRDLSDDK